MISSDPYPAENARSLVTADFALVLAAQCAFGLGWSTHLIQPKFLAVALSDSPATIGRVMAAGGFATVLSIPIVARLMDGPSRRRMFRAGALLLLLTSAGYLTVDHMTGLVYLLQAGIGVSYVVAFNAAASTAADLAPKERLGQAIGLLAAANVATNAISTALAEYLASLYGWRAAFGASMGFAVLALALSSTIREARAPVSRIPDFRSIVALARGPLGVVFFVSSLAGACFSAIFLFHQPFAIALGAKRVAPFFAGFTTSAVAVRVFFGSIGDRFGAGRVARIALAGYIVVSLAMSALHVGALSLYGLAFGLAHGIFYPNLNAHGVRLVSESMRGRVMTVYGGSFSAGTAAGTLAWGAIAEHVGFGAIFLVSAGLAALGVVVLHFAEATR